VDGRLALACVYAGGRTRLKTLRFEGLARSSRALADTGGAIRVLTAALGPGFLGGDGVTRDIDVGAGATLIVAAQMATPVFAGAAPSRGLTRASVAAGGALYAPGEPLLIAPGARHETSAELTICGDGVAFIAEIVALGFGARLRARTSAWIDGRLAVRDACDLEGERRERALLSAIVATCLRRATLRRLQSTPRSAVESARPAAPSSFARAHPVLGRSNSFSNTSSRSHAPAPPNRTTYSSAAYTRSRRTAR